MDRWTSDNRLTRFFNGLGLSITGTDVRSQLTYRT